MPFSSAIETVAFYESPAPRYGPTRIHTNLLTYAHPFYFVLRGEYLRNFWGTVLLATVPLLLFHWLEDGSCPKGALHFLVDLMN